MPKDAANTLVIGGAMTRSDAKRLAAWRAKRLARLAVVAGGPTLAVVMVASFLILSLLGGAGLGAVEALVIFAWLSAMGLYTAGSILWKACFIRHGATAGYYTCDKSVDVELCLGPGGVEFRGALGVKHSHVSATGFESTREGIFIECLGDDADRTPGKNTFFVPRRWLKSTEHHNELIHGLRALGAREVQAQLRLPRARLVESHDD